MLLPMIVIFGVFLFYPALNGLWISFTKWDGINAQEFVLFDNYIKLAGDGDFWRSFIRTMVFTVLSVPGIYVAALGLALLLTRAIKGSNLFRAIFYWPTMISSIVVGLSWRFLLGEFGVINYIISLFGGEKISWLTNPTAAMGVIIFVTVWSMAGYYMVMFVAGIKAISQDYYEASEIDGAGFWQQFWYITIPLLKNILFFCALTVTIDIWKMFNESYTLSGPGTSNTSLFQLVYENGFKSFNLGYASALSVVLILVLLVISMIQYRLRRSEEGV